MLYDLTLTIDYAYAEGADAGRHVLRLTPADLPGEQRAVAADLEIDPPPAEWRERYDFFGNRAVDIAYETSVMATRFTVRARVDRIESDRALDFSPSLETLAETLNAVSSLEPDSPQHFRYASPRIGPEPEIAAWAREVAAGGGSAFATALAISEAVNAEFTFDPAATLVDTPVTEAFRMKRGVCQDYAHVAIAALRAIGVPAGYVSGFIRTVPPEGQERLEGADAMHAWVRAWCGPDMGWVEFDPTNACLAGPDHIVVARGRDYFDLAPVKGALRTAGAQTSRQSVDLRAVDT